MKKAIITASLLTFGAAAVSISLSGVPLDEEAQAQTTPTPVRVTEPDWNPYPTLQDFLNAAEAIRQDYLNKEATYYRLGVIVMLAEAAHTSHTNMANRLDAMVTHLASLDGLEPVVIEYLDAMGQAGSHPALATRPFGTTSKIFNTQNVMTEFPWLVPLGRTHSRIIMEVRPDLPRVIFDLYVADLNTLHELEDLLNSVAGQSALCGMPSVASAFGGGSQVETDIGAMNDLDTARQSFCQASQNAGGTSGGLSAGLGTFGANSCMADMIDRPNGMETMLGQPMANFNKCLLSKTYQYVGGNSFVAITHKAMTGQVTWGDAERAILTSMTGSASEEKGVSTQSLSDGNQEKKEKQQELKEKQEQKAEEERELAEKDNEKEQKQNTLASKVDRRAVLQGKDANGELTPAEQDELSQLHDQIFELELGIAELSGDVAGLIVGINQLDDQISQLEREIDDLPDNEPNQDSELPSDPTVDDCDEALNHDYLSDLGSNPFLKERLSASGPLAGDPLVERWDSDSDFGLDPLNLGSCFAMNVASVAGPTCQSDFYQCQSPGNCGCGDALTPGSNINNQNFGGLLAGTACLTARCPSGMSSDVRAVAINNHCDCMEPMPGTGGSSGKPPKYPGPNPLENGMGPRPFPSRQIDMVFGTRGFLMDTAGSPQDGMTETERVFVPMIRRDL